MSEDYRSYVEGMKKELGHLYDISNIARKRGLDPSLETECRIAQDIADLVEESPVLHFRITEGFES